MKYISFCSGIEAATSAWHPLGWEPIAFCEIDKQASRVIASHYPGVPNLGDFTAVDWTKWSADICVGGTPCQAFSVAGLRKSLADDRGNLSLEFIRAVNIIRPRYVVWENVPGVLSTPDNAFGCFLAGLVGCEEPIVFEQGWPNAGVVDGPIRRCAWRVLDAQYYGLAQRRKRVFVVADSGEGPHPAEILFEWESMRRDSPPSREAGQDPAGTIAARTSGGGGLGTDFECDGDLTVGALCANMGQGNQFANSGQFVAHSLRADGFDASEDGTGRGTPLGPVAFLANAGYQSSVGEDISPSLLVQKAGGGGMMAVAFNLRGREGGSMPELTDVASMRASSGGSSRSYVHDLAVRRLTPRECERLQGFPDDHTLAGNMADGPRYKMLGNSMAVPVMAWIGRRIMEANK